ncbi:MAG: TPM domain-containing protein [Gemmataceae bacterium]|nr:TPM domain-containing protein [Gemmataceae bacterium]
MNRLVSLGLLPISLAACLWLAPLARAEFRAVQDQAGFFSANAVSEANRRIADIERKFKKDLVVETFAEPAKEFFKDVNHADKGAMNKAYQNWARQRATELKVNGIFVVITKKPGHVQVAIGNSTSLGAFNQTKRDELSHLITERFSQKKFDEALLEGVNFVLTTFEGRTARKAVAAPVPTQPADQQVPTQSGDQQGQFSMMGWLCPLVIIVGVVWLVIGLFRSMAGGGAGAGAGGGGMAPGYGGGGGGGFFSSLMGGMFGAAAGMWMYSHFMGGNSPSAWGGDQSSLGSSGGPADTDYTSSGGDFDSGDAGAGGDAGGGGGWFGGGGDDGGGGGGGWFGGGGDGGGGDFGGGGDGGGGGD